MYAVNVQYNNCTTYQVLNFAPVKELQHSRLYETHVKIPIWISYKNWKKGLNQLKRGIER